MRLKSVGTTSSTHTKKIMSSFLHACSRKLNHANCGRSQSAVILENTKQVIQ